MTPTRPYLIRAIYEWLCDNEHSPQILVRTDDSCQVPQAYVQNGEIVFNISPTAVVNLQIDNDAITFKARFGGNPHEVYVPMHAVQAIFAKENGAHGIGFDPNEYANAPKHNAVTDDDFEII